MSSENTDLIFILDKSGSMAGIESDTIGGFNSMLKKQKKLDGNCFVTTVLFDNDYELLHEHVDITEVDPMTEEDYMVGGCTALLDAIGRTIHKEIKYQKKATEEQKAKNVMFVIITDGEENSSVEYPLPVIKKLIKKQQEKYGWQFIFLGANIDAVETACNLGIKESNAADFIADGEGQTLNFETISRSVSHFREYGSVPDDCLDEIRVDMKKRSRRK